MPDAQFWWQTGLTLALGCLGFYNWYIHQRFKQAVAAADQARGEANGAKAAADIVSRRLEEHKLHAAEKFATVSTIERTEGRLQAALDKFEARTEQRFAELSAKIDGIS